MKTAAYWHGDDQGRIHCDLCPQRCVLRNGMDGVCRVRGARDDELVALSYGRVSSLQVDPIEKKPLYHFYPGHPIFSIGGWGCNLSCRFCQNWSISQQLPSGGRTYAPASIVEAAEGSIGMAFTYNEPLVGYEFVRDVACLGREAGLKNVLVTNGEINPEPAAALLPLIDALNIDIKSMRPEFYKRQCGGPLEAVLRFAEQACRAGCHVELTNLVIPGLNDADDDFVRLAEWIGEKLGPNIPLHLSAYRPCFEMHLPATECQTLERAWEICSARISYVYLGNVATAVGRDTHCQACDALLVRRSGFRADASGIVGGSCAACGAPTSIITP